MSISKANVLLICIPRFTQLSNQFVKRLPEDPLRKRFPQTPYFPLTIQQKTFYPHLMKHQGKLFILSACTSFYGNMFHIFLHLLCKIVFPLGFSKVTDFKLKGVPCLPTCWNVGELSPSAFEILN